MNDEKETKSLKAIKMRTVLICGKSPVFKDTRTRRFQIQAAIMSSLSSTFKGKENPYTDEFRDRKEIGEMEEELKGDEINKKLYDMAFFDLPDENGNLADFYDLSI